MSCLNTSSRFQRQHKKHCFRRMSARRAGLRYSAGESINGGRAFLVCHRLNEARRLSASIGSLAATVPEVLVGLSGTHGGRKSGLRPRIWVGARGLRDVHGQLMSKRNSKGLGKRQALDLPPHPQRRGGSAIAKKKSDKKHSGLEVRTSFTRYERPDPPPQNHAWRRTLGGGGGQD